MTKWRKRRIVIDAQAKLPKELTRERAPKPKRESLTWTLGEVIRRKAAEVLERLEEE